MTIGFGRNKGQAEHRVMGRLLDRQTLRLPSRVGPARAPSEDLSPLREAIRAERKLAFAYSDNNERKSRRVIWPFAIGYFPEGRILVGWCETRKDYRHFRTDRLSDVQTLDERYPRPGTQMFREWQQHQLAATRS